MNSLFYFDINIISNSGEHKLPEQAAKVMTLLHAVFSEHVAKFAIDFPWSKRLFSCIRVFAQSREDLDILAQSIMKNTVMQKNVVLSYPLAVPSDYQGRGVIVARYRIPSRASQKEGYVDMRFKRIHESAEKNFPYLMISSKSNGQPFSLVINRMYQDRYVMSDCIANSYGLSVKTKEFQLPADLV